MFKQDFPIFQTHPDLVYLDTGASAQKPAVVLETMDSFYRTFYSNVHRGNCEIANQATEAYERARHQVAQFIHADPSDIIFTKSTTESVNLVASSFAETFQPQDEVIVSAPDHHAVFVPFQQACLKRRAVFKVAPVLESGALDLEAFDQLLTNRTKVVAMAHLTNVLGTVQPIKEIIKKAHQKGAMVLVDGAQSVAHLPTDVTELDCDFLAFSGHKLYGPTGIGVLYGKKEALSRLSPYQFGGDMIREVFIDHTTFADIPARFEAGTPPIAEALGLASALTYLQKIGMSVIHQEEMRLTDFLIKRLSEIDGVEFLGDPLLKTGIVSFNIKNIHAGDIAFILAKQHICARVGHHCAMPIHQCYHKEVSLRVSLGVYNDEEDIEKFIFALKKAISFF